MQGSKRPCFPCPKLMHLVVPDEYNAKEGPQLQKIMGVYAQNTEVTPEKSRAEIERTLGRYGASSFMYGWEDTKAVVGFKIEGRHIRFILDMPDRNDPTFTEYQRGYSTYKRTESEAYSRWEKACRQKWRALALVVKAKLEAVDAGITTVEEEFMAHIVLPNNQTVGQFMAPQIQTAYDSGKMPKLLGTSLG